MDLIEFLRARLDEDEAPARAEVEMMAHLGSDYEFTVEYEWARHTQHASGGYGSGFAAGAPSPARVLAEVDAKRRAIDVLELAGDSAFPPDAWVLAREALRELAQPYRDHPGFDPSWLVSEAFQQRWVMGAP